MFTSLKNLLPSTLNRFGMGRQARAALICEHYRTHAPTLIHPNVLAHTFPKYYRNQALTVGVENAAWAHLVAQKKVALMKQLRSDFPDLVIERVTTQLASEEEKQTLFKKKH
ncbi:hypothetical protein CO046_01265 [Candidatus Peregrinibacteria bacterium CG_4_9_14_0_2_um_filter_53_11]|nr:MAG: hypothetical protein CO046_01265 [Candidatus Peregrinibacteria bacterium CG_4_9_14_0_2_um_filter_53_11]